MAGCQLLRFLFLFLFLFLSLSYFYTPYERSCVVGDVCMCPAFQLAENDFYRFSLKSSSTYDHHSPSLLDETMLGDEQRTMQSSSRLLSINLTPRGTKDKYRSNRQSDYATIIRSDSRNLGLACFRKTKQGQGRKRVSDPMASPARADLRGLGR